MFGLKDLGTIASNPIYAGYKWQFDTASKYLGKDYRSDDYLDELLGSPKKNNEINMLNYQLESDKYAYDKNLQQIMFNREDNAVQRRMADLVRAGLSPTLAAGSAAAAGPVVSTTAPQMAPHQSMSPGILSLLGMAKMTQDISKTQTDIDVAQAQKSNIEAGTRQMNWNTEYYRKNNIPTNAPPSELERTIRAVLSLATDKSPQAIAGGIAQKASELSNPKLSAEAEARQNKYSKYSDPSKRVFIFDKASNKMIRNPDYKD